MEKELHTDAGKDNNLGQLAVITGASRGIGAAIARTLAAQGLALVLTSRDIERLEAVKKEILHDFPHTLIHLLPADLSQQKAVKELARQILAIPNLHIEVLVHNAGIFLPGTIADEPDGNFEKQWQTNVASAYHLTRALLPHMKQLHTKPHIFTMCSTASIKAYPDGGSYCISKFALLGLTKVLREELKHTRIGVTAILPGATLTDSWEGTTHPSERFMQPNDIAAALNQAFILRHRAVIEELLIRPQAGDF